MMPKVSLLDDRPPAVAVGTPDLTFRNLAFKDGKCDLPAGELDNASSLLPNVVEIQDDWI